MSHDDTDDITHSSEKFANHPSVKVIKNHIKPNEKFEFSHVVEQDVLESILCLTTLSL